MKELTWDEQMFLGDKPGALGLYAAFREALLERFPMRPCRCRKPRLPSGILRCSAVFPWQG